MGWASGSELANSIWKKIRPLIEESKRKFVAKQIFDKFCDEDADDWSDNDQIIIDMKSKNK
jgi:hypothetical protein